MPRYAAIDIGSNSVRMLAADVDSNGTLTQLASERQVTRLGESVFSKGLISEQAMSLVCGMLTKMGQTYRKLDIKAVRAVATAAVRDASNQKLFLDRASEAIGSPVEIISGQEEARLIHLGVQQRWPHPNSRILIIDIGGGSAEIIVGEYGKFREAYSRPLGAVRLTGMFCKHDPPGANELAALQEWIEEKASVAMSKFRRLQFQRVIATSASASAIVCAANRIPRARRDEADRRRATAVQIRKLYRDLSVKNLAARRKVTGIGERRSEIIVPGAAVLMHVLDALKQPSLYYCAAGVREGIVADLAARRVGAELSQLSAEQRKVIEQTARRFGVDLTRARKVASIAHTLFESLEQLHKLKPEAGKLLEAAAHLYDTGHFISDTGHHKHSEYIVVNAELPAFTSRERQIIAALCRFHRKSMPGARHMGFQTLPAEDKRTALLLIPLLRLADALDRGKEQRVEGMKCDITPGAVQLRINSRKGIDLEAWASGRVAEIFHETYGRTLTVATSRA
ncbi:MAG: Ppx/GppA phosphatase family protein [Acidobacteriota bacterium]